MYIWRIPFQSCMCKGTCQNNGQSRIVHKSGVLPVQACQRPQSFLRKSNGDVIYGPSVSTTTVVSTQEQWRRHQPLWFHSLLRCTSPTTRLGAIARKMARILLLSCHTKDLAVQAWEHLEISFLQQEICPLICSGMITPLWLHLLSKSFLNRGGVTGSWFSTSFDNVWGPELQSSAFCTVALPIISLALSRTIMCNVASATFLHFGLSFFTAQPTNFAWDWLLQKRRW